MCSGASFGPVPGRVAASSDQPGRWWVTVCLDGVHLPQVFAEGDLAVIGDVEASGLCPECVACPRHAGCAGFALDARVGV